MNRRHAVVFSLLTASLSAQGINEFPEPNDSVATATPMAPGLQAQGTIGVAGDKDWYLFGINAPADIMATTGWAVGVTVDVDTVLTLFQSDGVTVVGVNDDRGLDRFSRLELVNVPANTPANPFYLLEVKKPDESTSKWDLLKVVATIPGDQAFRPESEGNCPLVKK